MTVIVPLQPQPNLGRPIPDRQHDQLQATPRAALSPELVAAAVASLPTLAPVLPHRQHEPEYCLASKRKAPADDDQDSYRATKKAKSDADALFGPLTTPLADAENTTFDITIEQALAAALFVLPASEPSATAAAPPSPPQYVDYPPRAQSPLANPALIEVVSDDNAQTWKPSQPAEVDAFFQVMPGETGATPSTTTEPQSSELPSDFADKPQAKAARPRPPPSHRALEPPLWKLACRARVDHVIQHYGGSTIRATLAHEAARYPRVSPYDSTISGPSTCRAGAESSSTSRRSSLRLQIYTPLSFASGSSSPVDPETEATESELEEDADMSFDLDWDSDSDADEEEEEADPSSILPDEHEAIMDVACDLAPRPLAPSPPPPPALPSASPAPITITISSDVPSLPRLSSIPVAYLREYPDGARLGTPSRVRPYACGLLTRDALRAQAQLEREASLRASGFM